MSRFESPEEERLDRELAALGDVPAPACLLPRVLARVETLERQPAWARRWGALPSWAQALSAASAAALALGALRLEGALLGRLWGPVEPWAKAASALSLALESALRAAASAWWAWRVPAAALGLCALAACAACGLMAEALSRMSRAPARGRA